MNMQSRRWGVLFTLLLGLASWSQAQEYKGHKYKGTIQSIDRDRLTLVQQDAELVNFSISPDVVVTRDDRPARLDQVQKDDLAVITAERSGNSLFALSIFVMEPE